MSAIWNGILDTLGSILAFFYAIIPSYGVAIIGLTILVRLALFPLTAKQARSMLAMQRLQPEIKKLQAKHKNDRQKLNEETMAFYKENKVNPLAGCLPLVAQAPIFIALFNILRNPFSHVPEGSSLYQAFCGGLSPDSCNAIGLEFLGVDLSLSAQDPHGSFAATIPYLILVLLVGISGYFQSRQSMRYQSQANAQTQMIGRIMPLIFVFISLSLPAGVVLYFLVSNVWQLGQQELIFRRESGDGVPIKVPATSSEAGRTSSGRAADKKKPRATAAAEVKSGGQAERTGKRSGSRTKKSPGGSARGESDGKRRPTTSKPSSKRRKK